MCVCVCCGVWSSVCACVCQSRNRALDEARARKTRMRPDVRRTWRCEIIRCGDSLQSFHDRDTWQKPKDLKAANAQGADKVEITPVAAAALLLHAIEGHGSWIGGLLSERESRAGGRGCAGAVPPVYCRRLSGHRRPENLIKIRRATHAQGGLRLHGATSPRARRRVSLEPHFVSI